MTILVRGARVERWPQILARFHDLLPKYPSLDVMPFVKLPHPPLLPSKKKEEWVLHLARSYRSVCAKWFGPDARGCELFLRVPSVRRKLRAAATLLHAMKISPIAWCAFSCEMWIKHEHKVRGKIVGAQWSFVYNTGRIKTRAEWLDWYLPMFRGGKVEFMPEHHQLLRHYERMRNALLARPSLDEGTVRIIVNAELPPRHYQRLLRRLEDRVEERTHALKKLVRNDEWIWG